MLRALTPVAFVLVLVAQLLPAASPCHAHEGDEHTACCHEAHDDGAGHHDAHWADPYAGDQPGHDEHEGDCRCPCHAPRAATLTGEVAVPVATMSLPLPTSERCRAPGHLETDRPPPRS